MPAAELCSQRQTLRIAPLSARRMEGLWDRQIKVVTGLSSEIHRAGPSDPQQATKVVLHFEIAVDVRLVPRVKIGDSLSIATKNEPFSQGGSKWVAVLVAYWQRK